MNDSLWYVALCVTLLLQSCRGPDSLTISTGLASHPYYSEVDSQFVSINATWFFTPQLVKIVNFQELKSKEDDEK